MQSNRALIIKYITNDDDDIAAFYLDRIGNLTNAEIMLSLCALSLQLGLAVGRTKEETKNVLVEMLDSLSEEDFKRRLSDSFVLPH
jgi:CRISPR/Cas system CSM-associated protein Csm2 small subunit